MKNSNKIFFGILTLMLMLTVVNVASVSAVSSESYNIDNENTYKGHMKANTQYTFRFRHRTQIRINSSANLTVNIYCDALKIGEKDFALEINCTKPLELNMTCKEEEAELGLLKGHTYQYRNRNRYRYEEGFCISLKVNCTENLHAKLMIQATEQNKKGKWAYYNETTSEWVTVNTILKDGYLVAETDHFSVWTILIPDNSLLIITGTIIGVVLTAGVIIGVIFYIRRRR
ncbi:MAG: hypothetical protein ACTSO4_02600 [Promethearchaeota archaeon]